MSAANISKYGTQKRNKLNKGTVNIPSDSPEVYWNFLEKMVGARRENVELLERPWYDNSTAMLEIVSGAVQRVDPYRDNLVYFANSLRPRLWILCLICGIILGFNPQPSIRMRSKVEGW